MEKIRKHSKKRDAILECICSTDTHPSAEWVYTQLKPRFPDLSLGTVYRNLNLLADEGAIVRMAFPVERYDANTMPHPHFRCSACGAVYDLGLPYDRGLDEQALLHSGHDVHGHEVLFHGICVGCKRVH